MADLSTSRFPAGRTPAKANRALTLSRYALLVESASDPILREQMAATGARLNAWIATWLPMIDSRDPDHHVHALGSYVTRLVLHQPAVPDPNFDPTDTLLSLLEALVIDQPRLRPQRQRRQSIRK